MTEVVAEVVEVSKQRKQMSPEQKQAAKLRRDAALIKSLIDSGYSSNPEASQADMAALLAKAEELAPQAVKVAAFTPEWKWGQLDKEEQAAIQDRVIAEYENGTLGPFLAKYISVNKLGFIASGE